MYRVEVGLSVISDLLDQGVRMGWTVSKTFGRKFDIKGVVQMGEGSSPVTVTDHSVSPCCGRLGV